MKAQIIDQLLEQTDESVEHTRLYPTIPEYVPHEDADTWYVECNRTQAQSMLEGKQDGTFLIRPRNVENSYALSVV